MEQVRMGIIGYGNMGTAHSQGISDGKAKGVVLAAICDISEVRRKAAAAAHPNTPVFASATEVIKSGLVDAIEIATPHYFHPEIAIEAFENGINVLVDKPAGVYTKQVLEMNAAAEKSGLTFGIMYNQRTNPVYQKIRELVQTGALGEIKRINWTVTNWYRPQAYHNSSSWRSTWKGEGGGTLINQNPHQLDLWQWMFGMPSKIMSHVSFGKYYDIEVEDDVTAYMEYDNGTTGVYITSTGEAPGTNRLEIACDMGRVVHKGIDSGFFCDDGTLYIIWQNGRIAPLNEKATAFTQEPRLLLPIDGQQVGYEGAGLIKVEGKYVLYAAEWNGDARIDGTYDMMYSVSDNLYGPYSPRKCLVPHAGHGCLSYTKEGALIFTMFGNDRTAPFHRGVGIGHIEISWEGDTLCLSSCAK